MSLREVVDNLGDYNQNLVLDIATYSLNEVKNKDKNIQRIISEILGKLIILQFESMIDPLICGMKDPNDNVRLACASASKYCF